MDLSREGLHWTEEDDETLRSGIRNNWPKEELSRVLRRSQPAIERRWNALGRKRRTPKIRKFREGVRYPRYTPEEDAALREAIRLHGIGDMQALRKAAPRHKTGSIRIHIINNFGISTAGWVYRQKIKT